MRSGCFALLVALLCVTEQFHNAEGRKMEIAEVRDAVKNLKKVCIEHSGVSPAIVEQSLVATEYPNDRKLQCYNKCILTMIKGMKENKLREKVMLNHADLMLVDSVAPQVKDMITKCVQQATSTDDCEVAWQFTKCFYEQARDLVFF